jgi:hypothetical protein
MHCATPNRLARHEKSRGLKNLKKEICRLQIIAHRYGTADTNNVQAPAKAPAADGQARRVPNDHGSTNRGLP